MMMGFIDTMRSEGHAVLSICRVLREQGCQIAARTYRAWRGRHVAARTITDAHVLDVVRDTALVRRTTIPSASRGAIDRVGGCSGWRVFAGTRASAPRFPPRTGFVLVIY